MTSAFGNALYKARCGQLLEMRQIEICLARNLKLSAIRYCGGSVWRFQRRTIGGGRGNGCEGCIRRVYRC